MPPGLHIEFLSHEHYTNAYGYRAPNEHLSHCTDFIWQSRFDEHTITKHAELEFAHISSSIVFSQGSPFYITKENGNMIIINEPMIIGHQSKPLMFSHDNENKLLGVKLKPSGFYKLFGMPAHELNNEVIPLREVRKASTEAVKDLDSLNSFLASVNHKPDYRKVDLVNKTITYYTSNICESKGIEELAYDNYLSHKTLTRYFLEVVGMQPRKLFSIIRMRMALQVYKAW